MNPVGIMPLAHAETIEYARGKNAGRLSSRGIHRGTEDFDFVMGAGNTYSVFGTPAREV
jgi:hypothetical protein